MKYAPIALFVFNRPDHTRRTLEALAQNELATVSPLYVFCDGARDQSQVDKTNAVQALIEEFVWPGTSKEVIVRRDNYGLSKNIISGVNEVLTHHDKIIVLEDDLITSEGFLKYMNDGLVVYKEVLNVYSVNAFQFPIVTDQSKAFLSPLGTSSWGWATWNSRWEIIDLDLSQKETLDISEELQNRFNIGGWNYYSLLSNKNSWAIRWYYTVFVRNGLGLFPTKTLIKNIGFDGSGTNRPLNGPMDNFNNKQYIDDIEEEVVINLHYHKLMSKALSECSSKQIKKSLVKQFLRWLSRI